MTTAAKKSDPLAPLRADIRDLGRFLGDVLTERGGDALFARVESIRAQTKEARTHSKAGAATSLDAVARTLAELPLDDSVAVARAFAHFLRLANIAEQHHRVRRRRDYQRDHDDAFQRGSADHEFGRWLGAGTSIERIEQALHALRIELVLTAHPTEAARRTTLRLQRAIARRLSERDRADLTPGERIENEAALRRIILTLWEGDDVRRDKPTPEEEARWGLAVVEHSLWSVVPAFIRNVDRALQARGGAPLPPEFAPITFASWMGGDRDGNPNVTPQVTESVVRLQQWMGADLFGKQIDVLRERLSITSASDELRDLAGGAREPYRAVLRRLRNRITATMLDAEIALGTQDPRTPHRDGASDDVDGEALPIRSREELLEPLRLIHRSLNACGLARLADGQLVDVMRQAAAFGPFLVRLDLRQEAPRHTQALDAITEALGVSRYAGLDEDARIAWLAKELDNPRPLFSSSSAFAADERDVVDTFKVAARLPRDAFGAYVISMCERASDVLAVDVLQKQAGLAPPLRVAPLFETQKDLENAGSVLERLLVVDSYRRRHGDEQEIMIGYSDSAKDAGRLSAAWALYTAQEAIVETCDKHSVRPTLFHGRGGTVGRGGGPTWLALHSQPPGSIQGRIRVTEQGEMIDAKFGIPEIAARTLELYVTGVLEAELGSHAPVQASWRRRMNHIAERSRATYRKLVRETPAFLEFYHEATPLDALGRMQIGSRPARRKPGRDVASLRAIPWVFAWSQSRLMVPAWLGFAEGMAPVADDTDLDELREMYRDWPFFRSTIDLIEMAMAKADPLVASHYQRRLAPEALHGVGDDLLERLEVAKARLIEITEAPALLESYPVLRRSIRVRNPYVDPLHVLQVELVERMRNADGEPDARLVEALNITISGIAAGIKNTG